MSGFVLEKNKGYSVVRFETVLHEMSWGDVENEAAQIVEKLKLTDTSRLIVDLSPMNLIQSGLVASLVRMWKATEGKKNRKVVVTTSNEVVQDVLRSAGLFKVFTVVNTREEAAYEVGAAKGIHVEQGEKHFIAWVALCVAILAVAALYPIFFMNDAAIKPKAETAGLILAAFACVAALFSIAKDEGLRRGLGVIAMVMGVAVLGCLFMQPGSAGSSGANQQESTGDGASDSKPPLNIMDGDGKLMARGLKPDLEESSDKASPDDKEDDRESSETDKSVSDDSEDTTEDAPEALLKRKSDDR